MATKTLGDFRKLICTVSSIYPSAVIIINNILARYDYDNLDNAGTHLNFLLRNLCPEVGAHFAFAGDALPPRYYAMFDDFYDVHLNREGYFLFAEEVVEEIYRVIGVVRSRQAQQIKFPSCMIPPVFKLKGAKERARDRRKYLQDSAERCRFTRPCLKISPIQRRPAPIPDHQRNIEVPMIAGEVCPATFPRHAGFYYNSTQQRTTSSSSINLPCSYKPCVARKKASKIKQKKARRARKRRKRKKKHKVFNQG